MGFVIAFTSCVQEDLFDLVEEDLSSDSMIGRRKFKSEGSDDNWQEIQNAMDWINSHGVVSSENECFAYALKNSSGKTMTAVRKLIGPMVFNNSNYWPVLYKNAVTLNGGLSTTDAQDASIISQVAGASAKTQSTWEAKFKRNPGTVLNGTIIVGINGNHYGVLRKVEQINGYWLAYIKDQTGDFIGYLFTEIDSVYW